MSLLKKNLIILFLIFLWSCSDDSLIIEDYRIVNNEEIKQSKSSDYNKFRNVYFGDLHVHTKYSFDAFLLGADVNPNSSYEFAKGKLVVNSWGVDMKLEEPLDFYAVTDHGLFLGVVEKWADTTSELSKLPEATPFHKINAAENLNDSSIL